MPLRKQQRHVHLGHVETGSDRPIERSRVFGFCEAVVNRPRDALVSPRSAAKDTEEERDSLAGDDHDILTLNGNGEALGEKMECDVEDRTEQDADRARTISDSGQPNKREREEHAGTHAQHRSWCIACVRGRVAMKHFRCTSADDERLHTFMMDCCFPSQGTQRGITVLVVKERNENKGPWCVHGPVKRSE